MGLLRAVIAFVGRIFISLFFIVTGLEKLFDWQASQQRLVSSLNKLLAHSHGSMWTSFVEGILPYATVLLAFAAAFELIGGFLILLSFRVRLGALLLIVFLIPVTCLSHHFWLVEGEQRSLQLILFLKNLAIMGGLLNLFAFGTGGKAGKASGSE